MFSSQLSIPDHLPATPRTFHISLLFLDPLTWTLELAPACVRPEAPPLNPPSLKASLCREQSGHSSHFASSISLEGVQLNGQVQKACEQVPHVPSVLGTQVIGPEQRVSRSLAQCGPLPSQTQPDIQGEGSRASVLSASVLLNSYSH